MAWISPIFFSIAYFAIMAAIAYWVVRYAVKHGVRDALKERDAAKGTGDTRPIG